jgi:mannose-6-phosphate isomerase-like protein (cupin superfamily)
MDVVVRTLVDTAPGGDGLVRAQVEIPPGSHVEAAAGPGGELWYVIDGAGLLTSGDGAGTDLRPDTAVWLPPGARYRFTAVASSLRMDSVTLPAATGIPDDGGVPRLARLEERAVEVTGDRRFRVLFGPGNGCAAATQFLGEIPPGRAPLHSHTYDEVVLVLDGEGVLHADPVEHPIAAGSCIHLPPGQQHCLENIGQTTLRVLGVFHPGGSPAAKTAAS